VRSSKNFDFFGFYAAVKFSSTAAPKNNLIVLKLWDSPSLQTQHVFSILGLEAEILTIEILEKNSSKIFRFSAMPAFIL
jgi:hypothetical protein